MHTSQTGIKGNADHVEIVTGVRNKLFLRHSAHRLNLVTYARGLFKLQRGACFLHTGNQLGKDLIVFTG